MAPRLHAPPPSEDEISGSPPQMTRKQVVSHCTGERKETTHGETPRTTTAEGVPCRRRNGLETREKSDHARDVHDVFNLVALFPIIVLTISNWDWDQVKQGESMEDAWSGAYFMEFWSSTLLYFLVDLMWVARVPICVKSPGVIVKHHVLVLFYLMAPMIWPEYRWFMGACMSVEINTWFLIARRLAYKKQPPKALTLVINSLFYASWVWIRCVIYPGILLLFLKLAQRAKQETGTLMHWPIIFLPIHFVLCVLNLKWTYDLLCKPLVKKWIQKEALSAAAAPSNGL